MKTLLILFISILSVIPCFSQQPLLPAYPREITYQGERAFFNGSPFTGLLVAEKTKEKIAEYRNGYKNGIFTEYFSKGKKKYEGNFINGIKDGSHSEWYENAILKVIYNYSNGKMIDGIYIVYDNFGKKSNQETYVNGKLTSNDIFKDGALIKVFIEKYANGTKKIEGIYKDGKEDGIWTWWYSNGDKKKEVLYERGSVSKLIYENKEDPELSIEVKRKPGSNIYRIIDGINLDTVYAMVVMNFKLNTGKYDIDKEVTPYFHELVSTFLEGRTQKMSENEIFNNRKKILGYSIEFSNFDFKLRRYPDSCQEACSHIGSASINMKIDNIISNYNIIDELFTPLEKAYVYYPGDTDFSVLKTLPYTLSGYIKLGMYKIFKVKASLNKITKLNKKGVASEVSLTSNLADYWKDFKFKVFIEGDLNSIAIIEKANKNNNDLTFKVTEGAVVLTKYMNEGKPLIAISYY